ncbi:uncharacterized protein LOC144421030 [Styela clava]
MVRTGYLFLLLLPIFCQGRKDHCDRLLKYCKPIGASMQLDGFVSYELLRFRCPKKNYSYEGPDVLECARLGVCQHPATGIFLNENFYEIRSVDVSVQFKQRKHGYKRMDVPIAYVCTKK